MSEENLIQFLVYLDVQRSFDQEFGQIGRQIDEIGDYWGDHLETVGNQMESRFEKFGNDMKNQYTNVRHQIGDFGNKAETVFNQQFGNLDQHLSYMNNRINNNFGHIGVNLDEFGTSLLSQFDGSFR